MKKILSFFLLLFITLAIFSGVAEAQSLKIKPPINTSGAFLNGFWKRISVISDGKPEANSFEQVRLFSDGFTLILGKTAPTIGHGLLAALTILAVTFSKKLHVIVPFPLL